MDASDALEQRLLAWMRGEATEFRSFDEAAIEVFRFQFDRNTAYRRYCEALGRNPAAVSEWRAIPAAPTDAFKFPRHRLSVFQAEEIARSFLTSGTTREVRGVHEFRNLAIYETSILAGWEALGLPRVTRPVFLSQPEETNPQSSLVAMFGVLARAAGGGPFLIDAAGEIDAGPLVEKSQAGEPVQLFGTAIAWLRFMKRHEPLPLPEGSMVFETGGYKGIRDAPEPMAFRAMMREFFGIGEGRILNEYSMTELSSQFYRWGDELEHRGPPWTRVRVIDPETGRGADAGVPGYLEIVDLANLGSVCAIRTQDLAIARGDSVFELLGRDPAALPRGCSRASDLLLR